MNKENDLHDVGTNMGRRRFLYGVGATAGAGALAATLPYSPVSAVTAASHFVPLSSPQRILDTRPLSERPEDQTTYPFEGVAPDRHRLQIAGLYEVSENASAAVITLTGVNRSEPNFVSVHPSDVPTPEASNLNMTIPNDVTANLCTVRLSSDGKIDIFNLNPAGIIVDLLGYYQPVAGAVKEGRFVGLPDARRAIDTRQPTAEWGGGPVPNEGTVIVDVTAMVPPTASSVAINLTATETTGASFFTAYPYEAGTVPSTSSLNVISEGATRASSVIVPVNNIEGRRRIKVYALRQAHIIVDVNGYFTGPDSEESLDGRFVPVNPVRILDTRGTNPGQLGPDGILWPGWAVEAQFPGEARNNASAAIINLTAVGTVSPGFLTVGGARQPIPPTSNVNFFLPGSVVPNHAFTPLTAEHGIQVFAGPGPTAAYRIAAVLVDYFGYFTGTPLPPTTAQHINPHPPPIGPPYRVEIPRLGLVHNVIGGPDGDAVVNSNQTWHWQGTAIVGQAGHLVLFGHRTEHGGPYLNIHNMVPGDQVHLYTADGRRYTYEMTARYHTDDLNQNIFAAAGLEPAPSLSIVACTRGNRYRANDPEWYLPTWIKERIVVNFRFVGWGMV